MQTAIVPSLPGDGLPPESGAGVGERAARVSCHLACTSSVHPPPSAAPVTLLALWINVLLVASSGSPSGPILARSQGSL